MKSRVRRAIRDEKGAVLIMVLILLVVGGLILTPLLGLMSTGLLAGKVYEKKMDELYAADAGMEDAIWRIKNELISSESWKPCDDRPDWDVYEYPKTLSVGNKSVAVVVYRYDWDPTLCGENLTYQILSTAATVDGGTAAIDSSTTVEAYIEPLVFDLLSGALVSKNNIDFSGGCTVNGSIYYVGEITGKEFEHNVEPVQVSLDMFPTQEKDQEFAQQFKDEAMAGGNHTGDMNVNSDMNLGPLYITGNLDIDKDVTVNLTGTIYVEGTIGPDGSNKEYTVIGSGSMVAVGDINLHKLPDYGVEGDTVIMSLNGDIKFWKQASIEAVVYAPNGSIDIEKDATIYGSVIGENINVKKDGSFTYVAKGSSFGFFDPVICGVKIETYTINPPESQ